MVTQPDLSSSVNEPETTALGFWQQIKEDWIAHGRDWTKPGFRAVAVQRFGVWRMKLQPLDTSGSLQHSLQMRCIERFEILMGLSYLIRFNSVAA
jgi:hypothetical protein